MDENMSDDDSRDNTSNADSAKRLKTENGTLEKEESSSSSINTEQEGASSSTDSGFPRSARNSRNRKRPNKHETHNSESMESGVEDEVVREEPSEETSTRLSNPGSVSSSDSTVIHDTDDTDSDDDKIPEVLKKPKPKHNWFIIPELLNRQTGCSAKYQAPELFMRRCYGSLRNVQRLELMYKLEEHEGCVNSLNFHPDGTLLASGSDDRKVVIWDWRIGKCVLKFFTKHGSNVFQSKFLHLSGDLHIATCARDGQVRIAQVSREEGLRDNRKLGSHRGPCHKLAVLPDQPHLILSAGEDGLVLRHDVRKNKPDKIVSVQKDEREVALYSIHGHPLNTHEFCVSGREEIVRIYDQRKSNSPVGTYHPFDKSSTKSQLHVTCAVYNHDGTEILASYNDDDIYLFDVKQKPGHFIHQYTGHRNGATIKGVNFFGPKSEFIVSGSDCGNVFFWERNTEAIVQCMLADDNGVVNCLEPHPQLPFICTSGLDWDVKVWVPSCEKEPAMGDLAEIVRNNNKLKGNQWQDPSINESQMLWMLWRHLRNTSRMRTRVDDSDNIPTFLLRINEDSSSSGSSTNSSSSSDDEDGPLDGPAGCTTS